MKTVRRCLSPRAMPLTPLRRWTPMAPMRSAGTSTPAPLRGFPSVSHGKAVREGQRKLLSTLWNTYAFYVLYANIDEFDRQPDTSGRRTPFPSWIKWLLSKLNTMVREMDDQSGTLPHPRGCPRFAGLRGRYE